MFNVKVIGAGSIGNHLTHGCRSLGWNVTLCDLDAAALERTQKEIYPSRYGAWDPAIKLASPDSLAGQNFDLTIIGTPPHTHLALANRELEQNPPKAMLIEKPLATPDLEGCQKFFLNVRKTPTFVAVGYNHRLTPHTVKAAQLIKEGALGEPLSLRARFREHWGGIFAAHPWLKGPQDSYLGFTYKGGGAGGEHSHGINIWQHFAHLLGKGRVMEVAGMVDQVQDKIVNYDRIFQASVRTDKGLTGLIEQDVVTEPAEKRVQIMGTKASLDWEVNSKPGEDSVTLRRQGEQPQVWTFPKKRPDDFKPELEHLGKILAGEKLESPIALERGLETMMVLSATHESFKAKRLVKIEYSMGYSPVALIMDY